MDVKEYIASGVVELYAMNALASEEKREFEKYLLTYPELSDELRQVSIALEQFSIDQDINPTPLLRTRIVDSLTTGVVTSLPEVEKKEKNTSVLAYKYLIAASLAALVISTFASWFFYNRWADAEDRYSQLLDDKNELAESYNLVKLTYDENLTKLFIMRDPDTRMFELKPQDPEEDYHVRVYWNKASQHTYIDIIYLPPPGEGKQYHLWAASNGQFIDAGTCSYDDEGLQQLNDIESFSGWLLTLEDKGATVPGSPLLISR